MQDKNQSEIAAVASGRGGFFSKQLVQQIGLMIGFTILCVFVVSYLFS